MESWAGDNAAFIAVSSRVFLGEGRVSFPPLAKGGAGGVIPARSVTAYSKGPFVRLDAPLRPPAKHGKAVHDARGVRPHPPWPWRVENQAAVRTGLPSDFVSLFDLFVSLSDFLAA